MEVGRGMEHCDASDDFEIAPSVCLSVCPLSVCFNPSSDQIQDSHRCPTGGLVCTAWRVVNSEFTV